MSEPKLRRLGEKCGAEGFGIYWGLMEKIGLHSSSFHLKVTGISEELDNAFQKEMLTTKRKTKTLGNLDFATIPEFSVQLLASDFFTTVETMTKVLDQATLIGLFDLTKWQKYHLLHSETFEHRADEYTRKLMRKEGQSIPDTKQNPDTVGTKSGHTPDKIPTMSVGTPKSVGTKSKKVRLQQQTQEQRQLEKQNMHACTPIEQTSLTTFPQTDFHFPDSHTDEEIVIPTEAQFHEYAVACKKLVADWNTSRKNRFTWTPDESELRKLFFGGNRDHKLMMCYQAFNINNEQINYPELVLRAVRLMLRSSEKKRIQNPTGWLWSCLHGNGDGTAPWVQLLTADEESSVGNTLSRVIASRSGHPP